MEAVYLGIDGGGTKTEALVCRCSGEALGAGTGGPSNTNFVSNTAALEAIGGAAHQARRAAGDPPVAGAAVCVPALLYHISHAELCAALQVDAANLTITGDWPSTFYGALGKATGVVVAAGTGSFATGIDPTGAQATVGGWGPLLGDEGSGYAIGRDALKAVIAEIETGAAPTALTALVFEHYDLKELTDLRKKIYQAASYQREVSSLAPLAAQAANAGDAVARQIIRTAAACLAEMALAVYHRLQWDESGCTVSLTGGVSRIGEPITAPFTEAVLGAGPGVRVNPPRFSPVVGAALLALKNAGVELSEELMASLERSLKTI